MEINPEIAKTLDKNETKDLRLKWLEEGIVKAARPLATAWSELLRYEYNIRKQQNPDFDVGDDPEIAINPPDAYVISFKIAFCYIGIRPENV